MNPVVPGFGYYRLRHDGQVMRIFMIVGVCDNKIHFVSLLTWDDASRLTFQSISKKDFEVHLNWDPL